jgi:hypothetical protein
MAYSVLGFAGAREASWRGACGSPVGEPGCDRSWWRCLASASISRMRTARLGLCLTEIASL